MEEENQSYRGFPQPPRWALKWMLFKALHICCFQRVAYTRNHYLENNYECWGNNIQDIYLEDCTQSENIYYSCVSSKNIFTCKLHTRWLVTSNQIVSVLWSLRNWMGSGRYQLKTSALMVLFLRFYVCLAFLLLFPKTNKTTLKFKLAKCHFGNVRSSTMCLMLKYIIN